MYVVEKIRCFLKGLREKKNGISVGMLINPVFDDLKDLFGRYSVRHSEIYEGAFPFTALNANKINCKRNRYREHKATRKRQCF